MPTGQSQVTKVHYKGTDEDFIVFIESEDTLKAWKDDRSIPLAEVVNGFKIFVTHKHGAQGQLDGASKSTLENEFGTKNEDEAIIKILEGGSVQSVDNNSKHPGRGGDRNDTMGGRVAH